MFVDQKRSGQQGFTLIELVIVIVILGILSAFALPRFADLGGDARAAAIEGAAGSVKSASSIVRSACLASSDCDETSGESTDADTEIDLEGTTVQLAYGYPTAAADGIQAAAQISDEDFDVDPSASPMTIRATGAETPANCQVSYGQVTTSGNAPAIATDVSGC